MFIINSTNSNLFSHVVTFLEVKIFIKNPLSIETNELELFDKNDQNTEEPFLKF
jgi:hypothetical protein